MRLDKMKNTSMLGGLNYGDDFRAYFSRTGPQSNYRGQLHYF